MMCSFSPVISVSSEPGRLQVSTNEANERDLIKEPALLAAILSLS